MKRMEAELHYPAVQPMEIKGYLTVENLYRLCHIAILVLVTAFITWMLVPRDAIYAQAIPSIVSQLTTEHAVSAQQIKSLETQYAALALRVEEQGKAIASIQSVGSTLIGVIGLLSALGLLTKKKT